MHRVKLDWKSKLHAAFVEMTDAYGRTMLELAAALDEAHRAEDAAGPSITVQEKSRIARRVMSRQDELLRRLDTEIREIDNRHKPLAASPLCYPYLTGLTAEIPTEQREAQTLFEWLHWERHHESANKDTDADMQGDLDAWERLARTGTDWRTINFKKGTIKPFQGGTYHQDLLQIGLSFATRMEELTAEEVADFFDTYCPCQKIHDSRALRKQFVRLVKDLEKTLPADGPKP